MVPVVNVQRPPCSGCPMAITGSPIDIFCKFDSSRKGSRFMELFLLILVGRDPVDLNIEPNWLWIFWRLSFLSCRLPCTGFKKIKSSPKVLFLSEIENYMGISENKPIFVDDGTGSGAWILAASFKRGYQHYCLGSFLVDSFGIKILRRDWAGEAKAKNE